MTECFRSYVHQLYKNGLTRLSTECKLEGSDNDVMIVDDVMALFEANTSACFVYTQKNDAHTLLSFYLVAAFHGGTQSNTKTTDEK